MQEEEGGKRLSRREARSMEIRDAGRERRVGGKRDKHVGGKRHRTRKRCGKRKKGRRKEGGGRVRMRQET